MRVALAAGGTGGHLIPALAVGRALRSAGHKVHFIVKTDPTLQEQLAHEGFSSSAFQQAGFPRGLSLKLFAFPFVFLISLFNARRILSREQPNIAVGMGGYASFAVAAAAHHLNIPLVIHEQNKKAGLANRLLAFWAAAIGTAFPDTRGFPSGAKVSTVGLPLRDDILPRDPAAARAVLGLDREKPTLLVFGGSQGARGLNRWLKTSLSSDEAKAFRNVWQIIHLTGARDFDDMASFYAAAGWKVFVKPFWQDMSAAYSAADLIVARSGAGTVMEILRMEKPAMLVPFPHATDNHQEANARYLESLGRADVVLENDLTEEHLMSMFKKFADPAALRRGREEGLTRVDKTPSAAQSFAALIERTYHERI